MKKKRTRKRIGKLLAGSILLAALAYAGFQILQANQSGKHAREVLEVLRQVVPNFGVESETSSGSGRDPLAALSIDGADIVGCLEIPSLDLMGPVTAKGYEQEYFATVVSGSPVRGRLRLVGGRNDTFRDLAKVQPGDKVIFTDIDGVRYSYSVTTQFHLKNWDEADQDLMLCYVTDDQTQFVVGCSVWMEK